MPVSPAIAECAAAQFVLIPHPRAAWPSDLDFNLHMTNARYLALMDPGRLDLIFRTGMLTPMIRRRWRPMAAAASIRFRRSLKPFRKFRVRSRLVCWDERRIFFEQRFECDGQLMAGGYIKALLRDGRGKVPTVEILKTLGRSTASPAFPESVALRQQADAKAQFEER